MGTRRLPERLLGCDEACVAVPASVDVDEVVGEVDVVPVEGLEFAERGGRRRGRWRRSRGRRGGARRGAVLTSVGAATRSRLAAHGGEGESEGGVDGDVVAAVGAAVDRAQRQDRVSDAARREPLGGELVGEVLQHRVGDRGQSFRRRGLGRRGGGALAGRRGSPRACMPRRCVSGRSRSRLLRATPLAACSSVRCDDERSIPFRSATWLSCRQFRASASVAERLPDRLLLPR